jgi:hypothetical protein
MAAPRRPAIAHGVTQAPDGTDITWTTIDGNFQRADGTGADGVGHHLISVPAAGQMVAGTTLLFYEQPVGQPIARVFVWRSFADLAALTWNTQMTAQQHGVSVVAQMDYLSKMRDSVAILSGQVTRRPLANLPGFELFPPVQFREDVALEPGTFTVVGLPPADITPQDLFPDLAPTFAWWQPVLDRFAENPAADVDLPPIPIDLQPFVPGQISTQPGRGQGPVRRPGQGDPHPLDNFGGDLAAWWNAQTDRLETTVMKAMVGAAAPWAAPALLNVPVGEAIALASAAAFAVKVSQDLIDILPAALLDFTETVDAAIQQINWNAAGTMYYGDDPVPDDNTANDIPDDIGPDAGLNPDGTVEGDGGGGGGGDEGDEGQGGADSHWFPIDLPPGP